MTTSDGVSSSEWGVIELCAEEIVDASSLGIDCSLLISNLIEKLRELEVTYGRLPSILATEADYTEDEIKELSLLKEAYVSACEITDYKNMTYISSSLAEYYVERVEKVDKANYWLQILGQHLDKYSDNYIESVYEDVRIFVTNNGKKR